ncbi:hypothetical protein ACTU3I_00030 [Microbacterium sp. RD1]|uniref:hypothetical protein n=1 Tax=Microbacterium sp. RD1 TaxID=3457313 RepID=UPI003FA52ED1
MPNAHTDINLGPAVTREKVDGTCAECGADDLARYPVLSEGGWFLTTKCQSCLASASRDTWDLLGPIHLTSHGLSLT